MTSRAPSASPELRTLNLWCERHALGDFAALLQSGVTIPARTGVSVIALLTEQLGIAPGEVAERIKTVFLDGQVVDALDRAIVRDGAVLALSAAMPGLVGATLRRDGFYAAMREGITHAPEAPAAAGAGDDGTVRLKLFNLLIEAFGPRLLARGVVLGPGDAPFAPPALRAALGALEAPVLLRVSSPKEVPACP